MSSIGTSVKSATLYGPGRTSLRPRSFGGSTYAQLNSTRNTTTGTFSLALEPDSYGPVKMKDLTEAYDDVVHPGEMQDLRARLKEMKLREVIKNPEYGNVIGWLLTLGLAESSSFELWYQKFRQIVHLTVHPPASGAGGEIAAIDACENVLGLDTVVEL